jgi:TM2 domain-containing membrane protein YozV
MTNNDSYAIYDSEDEFEAYGRSPRTQRHGPSPGIAAVLSVLIPGLGQVYCGRLISGLLWFLAASCGYAMVLVPGFLIHCLSVWRAYREAKYGWRRY